MPIRNVNVLPQTPLLDTLVRPAALDARAPRQAGAVAQSAGVDRIEISDAARRAVLVGELARRVLDLPEAASPHRVDAARAALARGQLDTPAAARAAATAMIAGA